MRPPVTLTFECDKPQMSTTVLNVADKSSTNKVVINVDGIDFTFIKEIGIRVSDKPESHMWLMSDKQRLSLELEKRNLIRAKVKAIVGTAVLGAAFAVVLGALIGTHGTTKR